MNTARYTLTFTLPAPDTSRGPTLHINVEARSEDEALDRGFDEAFRRYPQYGGFQCEKITRKAAP
jgi:hypothetical protein